MSVERPNLFEGFKPWAAEALSLPPGAATYEEHLAHELEVERQRTLGYAVESCRTLVASYVVVGETPNGDAIYAASDFIQHPEESYPRSIWLRDMLAAAKGWGLRERAEQEQWDRRCNREAREWRDKETAKHKADLLAYELDRLPPAEPKILMGVFWYGRSRQSRSLGQRK